MTTPMFAIGRLLTKCRSCLAIQLKYSRAGSSQRRSSPMPFSPPVMWGYGTDRKRGGWGKRGDMGGGRMIKKKKKKKKDKAHGASQQEVGIRAGGRDYAGH